MSSNSTEKRPPRDNLKEYLNLVEAIAKTEFKKLSNSASAHLMDYSELVNIGAHALHNLSKSNNLDLHNSSYLTTAIKWAIRNEMRRRYRWYALKAKPSRLGETVHDINYLRETVYKTILSVEDMADSESPTLLKDVNFTPDEKFEFTELSTGLREAIKKLPQREKELIEGKFYKDKKLRELTIEFGISPSRISRIIQSGLNKIRRELQKQDLV